jgi:ABC-type polysaccharide/polyol phosphate export permease
MMGSYLLLFFLGWTITLASIWVYFEDYYKNKKDNDKGGI